MLHTMRFAHKWVVYIAKVSITLSISILAHHLYARLGCYPTFVRRILTTFLHQLASCIPKRATHGNTSCSFCRREPGIVSAGARLRGYGQRSRRWG